MYFWTYLNLTKTCLNLVSSYFLSKFCSKNVSLDLLHQGSYNLVTQWQIRKHIYGFVKQKFENMLPLHVWHKFKNTFSDSSNVISNKTTPYMFFLFMIKYQFSRETLNNSQLSFVFQNLFLVFHHIKVSKISWNFR